MIEILAPPRVGGTVYPLNPYYEAGSDELGCGLVSHSKCSHSKLGRGLVRAALGSPCTESASRMRTRSTVMGESEAA